MKKPKLRWFTWPVIVGVLFFLTTMRMLETDVSAQSEFQATGDLIMDEGTILTRRGRLNFTGDGVTCADNAGSTRTDCTISGGGATKITSGVVSPNAVGDDFAVGGTTSAAPFFFDASTGIIHLNTVGGGISVAPSLTTGSALVLDEALEDAADYNAGAGTGTPNTFTLKVSDAGLASNLLCTIDSAGVWTGACPSGGGDVALNDLTNVTVATPIMSQVLTYNSYSSLWYASTITQTLAGQTDTTIASPADGEMLIYDGDTSKWINLTQAGPVELLIVQIDIESEDNSYYPSILKQHSGVTTGITHRNSAGAGCDDIELEPGLYRLVLSNVIIASSGTNTCKMDGYLDNTLVILKTYNDPAGADAARYSSEITFEVGAGETADICWWQPNCAATDNDRVAIFATVERY